MTLSFIPTTRRQTSESKHNVKKHEKSLTESVLSPNRDIPIAASHPLENGWTCFEENELRLNAKQDIHTLESSSHVHSIGNEENVNSFRVAESFMSNTNTTHPIPTLNNPTKTSQVRVVNEKLSNQAMQAFENRNENEFMKKDSNDSSILQLQPSLPPIPAEHPSQFLHQRSHSNCSSLFSNPLVQNIPDQSQSNAILKASLTKRNKKESTENHSIKGNMIDMDGLDRGRVLDPRSRAILDLEPVLDSRQLRILSCHKYPTSASQSGYKIHESNSIQHQKGLLSEPCENSSRFIQKQMNTIQSKEFDPTNALQTVSHNQHQLKQIKDKVTVKVFIYFNKNIVI